MPHTTGTAGAGDPPLERIRLVDTWMTDRLHNSADALQKDIFTTPPADVINTDLTSALLTNYSQVESDVFVDIFKGLVARGGYRYMWGNADELVLPPEGLVTHDRLRLQRNMVLGGLCLSSHCQVLDYRRFRGGNQRVHLFPNQPVRLPEVSYP